MKSILGLPQPIEPAAVAGLVAQLQVPEAIAAILVRRGHADPDAAKAFLRPRLEDLHDPWTLPDMETAVERIASAIDDGERILIHGDYDVDGVCGTALLTRALRELGARVEPFVPNRLEHGYDFGPAGLAAALERECGLVLTCDCGIAAHETVAAAGDAGIDVVISDHHTPSPELPPAVAVLNPHRDDSGYPEKVLCGAGVAFKLLQALFQRRGRGVSDLYKYLDLVGIPTIADLVPLTGENRILARFGLKVLERTPNPGLRALLRVSGLRAGRPISAGQIAFVIGPRINAVGRMGEAMRGVKLLLTEDEAEAAVVADVVEAENRLRREVDRATLDQAKAILEESFDPDSQHAIVLASQDWHPGVIGIVASRIVEQYYRPTVLIALDGDSGRGSGRSIPGFHLYDALQACESHLLQFGGHRAAAGVQIRADEIEAFRDSLNAVAHEWLGPEDLLPKIRIDHELSMTEVSAELWRFLNHFGPYGQGNPKPVFLARDVALHGAPEVVGEEHLRLRIEVGDGATPEAIAFGQAAELEWLNESSRVDLAFQVGVREWQGVEYVQAQVLDVRPSEAAWASYES
ncbi:MAG: single-stranded-DNA-specific exonuclease RecJ [Gemmatimonadetes bacterium]|nr:single-stranded-DNA-specific exonuclease RecJ [Gemmatimonadota bacterium]NIO32668.1 single-stranded-DNA-specific exonuclease RecJ [Gemmatimonadota bacterium]